MLQADIVTSLIWRQPQRRRAKKKYAKYPTSSSAEYPEDIFSKTEADPLKG
jgi:hypothetical protein